MTTTQAVAGLQGAPEQFGAEGQATGVADAICGPVAAIAFARAMGRQPTIAEALEIAKANGRWDPGTGMHGPAAEAALLTDMGVPNRLDAAPTREAVIADVASGNPVILSSPGHYHYFVVTGYDPKTGLFDTGNTGTALRGGSRYRTWEDIGPQAALFMQEPSARGPSAAVAPTTTSGAVIGATNQPTDIEAFVRQKARQYGIDPDTAVAVANAEGGLDEWNRQSDFVYHGKREESYGPFQLFMSGGLGNAFQQETGLDPRDPANGPAATDWALRYASQHGWGDWHGAQRLGLDNFAGIGGNAGATTPGGTPTGRRNDSPFAPAEQPSAAPPEQPASDPWTQVNATLQDTRDRLTHLGQSATDTLNAASDTGVGLLNTVGDRLIDPNTYAQSAGDVGTLAGQGASGVDAALREAYRTSPGQTVTGIANWVRTGDTSGLDDPLQRALQFLPGQAGAGAFGVESAAIDPLRRAGVGGALALGIPQAAARTALAPVGASGLVDMPTPTLPTTQEAQRRYAQLPGWLQTATSMALDPGNLIGAAPAGRAAVRGAEGAARVAESAAPEVRARALLAGGQGVRDMAALGFGPDVGGEAVSLGRAVDESNAARPRRNVVRPPGQPPRPESPPEPAAVGTGAAPPPEPLPVAEAAPPSEPPTAPPAARPVAPPVPDVVAAIKRVDPAISDEQALAEAQFYDRFGGPRKAAQGIRSNPKFGTGEPTMGEGLLPRTEQVADALENPAIVAPPPPAAPARPGFAGRLNVSKFPPAIQEALHAAYAADPEGFEAASRGTISDPELERMASEVDIAPLLDKWKPGTIWTAEEQRAARIAVAKTFKDVRDAASAGDSTEATNALALAVQRAQAVAGVGSEAGRLLRQQRSTVAADELLNWREIARGGVEDAFARVNGVHDEIAAVIRDLPDAARARATAALDEARAAADEGYQAARNGVADHPAEPGTNGTVVPKTRVEGQQAAPPPEAAPPPPEQAAGANGRASGREPTAADLKREQIRADAALKKEQARQARLAAADRLAADNRQALAEQRAAAAEARKAYRERIELEQRREAAKDSTRAAAERQAIRGQQAHELRLRAAEDRHAQAMVKLFDAISDPARRNTVRQLVNTLGGRNKNLTPWQQAARAIKVAQRGRTIKPDQQQQLYKNLIKAVTGTDDPTVQAARMQQLRHVVQSGDTVAMGRLLQEANQPGFWDHLQGYYVANLLSAPATHLRNIIGNTVSMAASPVEHAIATPIEAGLSALQGRPRERFLREIPQEVIAWGHAIPEAWQRFSAIMRYGFDPANMERLANVRGELRGGAKNPANLIFRGLGGMDAFFGHLVYQGQIHKLAYRQARMEGLSPYSADFARRVADLLDVPPVELIEKAQKAARYRTFHQEMTGLGTALNNLKREVPAINPILPFVSTPYNIIKYDLERSPLGLANIGWDVAKGRYGGPEPTKEMADISDRLSRVVLGSVVLYGTAKLYAADNLTGNGPTDPGERDLWLADHQPNSIRVGDHWVSWQNMPGVSTNMGMMTGMLDAQQYGKGDAGQQALGGVQGALRAITQRSFLQGVANLADAVSTGGGALAQGQRFITNTAFGYIPASAAVRRVAQGLDQEVKQPLGLAEQFTQNLPGLSQSVQPKLDRRGQPITRDTRLFGLDFPGSELAGSLINPAQIDSPTTDPTILQAEAQGQPFPGTGSTLAGQSLTPEQQRRYQQVRGQLVTARRTALYASPAYKAADAATQQKYADMADNAASAQARDQVMSEFGISTAKDGEPPKYDATKPWVQKLMRESNSADVDALARQISQAASTPAKDRTPLQRKLAYYAQYSTAEWRKWSAAQKKARGEMQGVVRGLATATP